MRALCVLCCLLFALEEMIGALMLPLTIDLGARLTQLADIHEYASSAQ